MLFLSPQYPQQEVVLKPARHTMDTMGNRVFVPGITIKFVDGQYSTDDREEIEAIKKLNIYGTEIFSGAGDTQANPEAIKRLNIERSAVPDPTACSKCSFKAKTKLGLIAHMRKHENVEPEQTIQVSENDLLPPPGE